MVADQIGQGQSAVSGVMLESFLVAGAQSLDGRSPGDAPLVYGQSVTDKCMDFATTVEVIEALASAVVRRR